MGRNLSKSGFNTQSNEIGHRMAQVTSGLSTQKGSNAYNILGGVSMFSQAGRSQKRILTPSGFNQ